MTDHQIFTQLIAAATSNVKNGGGPFAAAVVDKNNEIVAMGVNSVTLDYDPTAHAEVNAIRKACQQLKDFNLQTYTVYSTCEPCPLCLSACYWSRVEAVVFSSKSSDANVAGFDDEFIYKELKLPAKSRILKQRYTGVENNLAPFHAWLTKPDKKEY